MKTIIWRLLALSIVCPAALAVLAAVLVEWAQESRGTRLTNPPVEIP